jgi:dolichol-phosphate mannosyltransferase
MSRLFIVIPTYNEIENLSKMVDTLQALSLPDLRILVVDDNSPDGTGKLADELAAQYPEQVFVLHRQQKQGLGVAYRDAFRHITSNFDTDYVLQMDCDFSHQPKYVPMLLAKGEEGYDIVVGSRWMKGGGVEEKWPWYRKLLSWFANRVYVTLFLRMPLKDATGGYRLWRRETLIGIDLDRIESNGYVFQVETAYIATRLGYKIAEVPIYFPDRELGHSKMDFKIQLEAAIRVFDVLRRHHGLTPKMRRTEAYTVATN